MLNEKSRDLTRYEIEKKKILEDKKKNPISQKSEISKDIQKLRKTVARKTENRKTNNRKTAIKSNDEKQKEENDGMH